MLLMSWKLEFANGLKGERVKEYATAGSLSRHFRDRHVKLLSMGQQIDCNICDVKGMHRMRL
jgi:hypothetical protein